MKVGEAMKGQIHPMEPKWPPMTLREWYRYHRSEGMSVGASVMYGLLDYLVN
jgi:hypothetical protein